MSAQSLVGSRGFLVTRDREDLGPKHSEIALLDKGEAHPLKRAPNPRIW